MATSVVFDLVGALVTRFDAALSAHVYDGYGVTDEPGDFVMVGVEDPDSDRGVAVDARQEWAGIGAERRNEAGSVTCVALSWNGDADLSAARAAVKAIVAAIENDLRSAPDLAAAVTGLQWVGFGTRIQLIPLQAEDGACVMCVFDIDFKARI